MSRLRSRRGALVLVALVALAVLALALTASGDRKGRLDPRAVDGAGSRALARVLSGQGVDVQLARTTARASSLARSGDTLLVVDADLLAASQLRTLAGLRSDLVLVAPGQAPLQALAPWAEAVREGGSGRRTPQCDLPAAVRAGSARVPGVFYSSGDAGARQCYRSGDAASVLARTDATSGRTVTVLGSEHPLTNDGLDDEGDAALVLGLLGARPRLVWYLPSPDDVPAEARRSLSSLLPDGVRFGALQALLAALVVALWRGRRLGPVVTEPLPVVVPAAEAVEGRARLYRRGRARGHAADVLRRASVDRLAALHRLPRGAPPEQVVSAVAAATGRSGADVAALLYGAAPGDDAALVRLAGALDALEEEVRRP
ncbi:uncharacterized protein DUF4350 [Motilibacter peucedani]|uniref:Uncharacterized protein DUF4350 n=1 Tax=Motilibacter peucedani TaxID=598650 RepID=A0A420XMP8_9ACTN|nr:DUF4350 domain-containing protein [Motilibacter peucedani]RKS72561.1 uncharacterized protein DUF4350 [Motilibacter peucedani]